MEIPEKLDKHSSDLLMELVRGKEYASQLQAVLDKPIVAGNQDSALAEELAENVFRSFNDSLVKLGLFKSSQIGPDEAANRALSGRDLKSQHFVEGIKNHLEVKNRRGCYQRRRQVESSVIYSPTMDDGYAWRKYGQKDTLNSKYPRCYFRCSHKYDEGCRAIKQVQKVDDDDDDDDEKSIYKTTYFGSHTCKNLTKALQIIISDSETVGQSTNMICFQGQVDHVPFSTVEVNHQEAKGENQSEVTTDNVSSNNSDFMWHDYGAARSSEMEFYPRMEDCFNDQEAASGSLVHLHNANFKDNTQLF